MGIRGRRGFWLGIIGLWRRDFMVDLRLRKFLGERTFLVGIWETKMELALVIFLDRILGLKVGGFREGFLEVYLDQNFCFRDFIMCLESFKVYE